MHAIQLKDVTRRYGPRTAVDRLTLAIQPGEVFGFVGPNGAGKTSTLRMIAGLLAITGGEILVGGHSVSRDKEAVLAQTGYMPDYFGLYPDLKVWEYLDFFAACYRIPPDRRPRLAGELLELVDLSHRRGDPVESLSRGMKQRLSLARALLHDPQVLLLDEPASGLDPRARVEIRELLVELARMGKTVFFSTHILADVAEICTRVGILEEGHLVALGSLEELHLQIIPARRVELTLLGGAERALELLSARPEITALETLSPPAAQTLSPRPDPSPDAAPPELAPPELAPPTMAPPAMAPPAMAPPSLDGGRARLAFDFNGEDPALSRLLADLVAAGLPVIGFTAGQPDLEEVFLRATKGIVS
jgi:ABC-2 type transport system ATP-binding protein